MRRFSGLGLCSVLSLLTAGSWMLRGGWCRSQNSAQSLMWLRNDVRILVITQITVLFELLLVFSLFFLSAVTRHLFFLFCFLPRVSETYFSLLI